MAKINVNGDRWRDYNDAIQRASGRDDFADKWTNYRANVWGCKINTADASVFMEMARADCPTWDAVAPLVIWREGVGLTTAWVCASCLFPTDGGVFVELYL